MTDDILPSGASSASKLVEAFQNDRITLISRVYAVRSLGQRGETDAVPALIRVLQQAVDPDLLAAVVDALGRIGDPSAVGILAQQIADSPYSKIRVEAVAALGRIRHPDAEAALVLVAQGSNVVVRREALRVLRATANSTTPEFSGREPRNLP
jgi:HEAT repeat protein